MARPLTLTLTGTLTNPDGSNAAGVLVAIAECISVRPATTADGFAPDVDTLLPASGALADDPGSPYPAYAPGALLFSPGDPLPAGAVPANLDVWQKTLTNPDGTFNVTVRSPSALCYLAGARTTTDITPQVVNALTLPAPFAASYVVRTGSVIRRFQVDETQATGGTLNLSSLLAAPVL